MKGTLLLAIVAIVVIIAATSIFIYMGLPTNTGVVTTNSIISASPESASLAYIITFAYSANPIHFWPKPDVS